MARVAVTARPTGTDADAPWQKNAARWIANADRIARMTAPVTHALLETLRPARGQRVLDLASGVGDPAFSIAGRVGATGAVTATDAVPAMLDALRERADALGLRNVRALCAQADALEVTPASFDAACSRFGVMFFGDAPRALRGMRRAVRADGRLVVAAWSLPERNPYFTLAMQALDEAGAPPVDVPPGTRTVWEYAAPGLLAATAEDAGWRDVRTEAVRFEMTIDSPPDGLLDACETLSERVETRVAGLHGDRREAARAALARAAARFARGAGVALPAEALLVSGRA